MTKVIYPVRVTYVVECEAILDDSLVPGTQEFEDAIANAADDATTSLWAAVSQMREQGWPNYLRWESTEADDPSGKMVFGSF